MPLQENNSSSTFLSVVNTIEQICRAHVAIADFDYGDLQTFNAKDYDFPLAYLETVQDVQETQRGSTHVYTVALNLVDRRSQEPDAQEFTRTQDRLTQLFFELKRCMQLEYFFHMERVGPADIMVFTDFSDVLSIRLRAEFTVEVDCPETDTPDLMALFPSLFQ